MVKSLHNNVYFKEKYLKRHKRFRLYIYIYIDSIAIIFIYKQYISFKIQIYLYMLWLKKELVNAFNY